MSDAARRILARSSEQLIFPALKPKKWAGWDKTVCRSLLPSIDNPHVPWVAFGYDREHTFEFLTLDVLSEGSEANQIRRIEQTAIQNLQSRMASWLRQEADQGQMGTLEYLVCRGDFLSAERILDPVFMKQAHDTLRSDMLAVGVPCRGFMFTTQAKQPDHLLRTFMKAVSAQFHSATSAPISPGVFVVETGVVQGQIQGLEESGPRIASTDRAGSVVQQAILRHKETGQDMLLILAGGKDAGRLSYDIIAAFMNGLSEVNNRGRFGGEIVVQILPELTPLTAELKAEITKVRHRLQGILTETKAAISTRNPARLKFKYGEEEIDE